MKRTLAVLVVTAVLLAAMPQAWAEKHAQVLVWSSATRRTTVLPAGVGGCPVSLAWSRDGRLLASGCDVAPGTVWAAPDWRPLTSLDGVTAPQTAVAFSPDGARVASLGTDGRITLFDTESGKARDHVRPRHTVLGMAFARATRLLVLVKTGDAACAVDAWDLATERSRTLLTLPRTEQAALAADGSRVATRGAVLRAGRPAGPLALVDRSGAGTAVAISPNGRWVAVAVSGAVKVWDLESRASRVVRVTGRVRVLAVRGDGGAIATDGHLQEGGERMPCVRVFDTKSGAQLGEIACPGDAVWSLAWSPDGAFLGIGGGPLDLPPTAPRR